MHPIKILSVIDSERYSISKYTTVVTIQDKIKVSLTVLGNNPNGIRFIVSSDLISTAYL